MLRSGVAILHSAFSGGLAVTWQQVAWAGTGQWCLLSSAPRAQPETGQLPALFSWELIPPSPAL